MNHSFFTVCVSIILFIHTTKSHNTDKKFLAVQMFGDSILDTGNNNGLPTIIKSNFFPYGQKFGKPTGRFSDGKLTSDLIAEAFGIKETVPSFHDPNLTIEDLQTGLCFASAGSGYDPLTSEILQVYNQQDELRFFKRYIERLTSYVGEEKTKTIIEKSLYVISSGNNDLFVNYFTSLLKVPDLDVHSYTNSMIKYASRFFKALYGMGARKVAVLGVFPLGCTPLGRTLSITLNRGCSRRMNRAAQIFNTKLVVEIASIRNQFPDFNIIYIDVYNHTLEFLLNYKNYGFRVGDKACCSFGSSLETGLLCNPLTPTCTNSSEYVFWDAVHPTEAASRALAPLIIKQIVF